MSKPLPTQRLRSAVPWVIVVAFTGWAVWPLIFTKGYLFGGGLRGDYLRAAWLYDFVSRELLEGRIPMDFNDFGWPAPISRRVTLPNFVDAAVVAPLHWLLPWPMQWGATQAAAVAACAGGMAWMTRSLGARGLGVVVAGCLGAVLWPTWRELHTGHLNTAWLGVTLAAVAAFIDLTRGLGVNAGKAPPLGD